MVVLLIHMILQNIYQNQVIINIWIVLKLIVLIKLLILKMILEFIHTFLISKVKGF